MKKNFLYLLRIALLLLLAGCSPVPVASTPTASASPTTAPATEISASPTAAPPSQTPLPSGMVAENGNLLDQIEYLERSMPRANSEAYVIPTDEEKRAFAAIVKDIRSGALENAITEASDQAYELILFTDQNESNSTEFILREINPSMVGWGMYVFRADANSSVIIEAPHPIFDQGTPDVAADLFRSLGARSLMVAGAHRDANDDGSADVSAREQSIFEAVHEAELQQALASTGSAIVLQIHGFGSNKHPHYPQAVISYEPGSNINPADIINGQKLARRMTNALNENGIHAGLCGSGEWRDLCGKENIQSSLMTRGIFIHIELDESIRQKDSLFIDVLTAVMKK